MQVWGVSPELVKACVITASNTGYQGNVICDGDPQRAGKTDRSPVNFKLRVADSRESGARFGHMRNNDGSRRRTPSACWHAHRDVMAEIFRVAPHARLKTAMADYRGAEDFEAKFESTGNINIGSMVDPQAMSDACECDLVGAY